MWEAIFRVDNERASYTLRPVRAGSGSGTVTKSRESAARYIAAECEKLSLGCVEAARHAASSVVSRHGDGRHTASVRVSDGVPAAVIRRVETFAGPHGDWLARCDNGTIERLGTRPVYDSRREAAVAVIEELMAVQRSAQDVVGSLSEPPFPLGQIVATAAVARGFSVGDLSDMVLARHMTCDWGDVCEEDWDANDLAVESGERLLSAYTVSGEQLWAITEADRSVTTILRPEEY